MRSKFHTAVLVLLVGALAVAAIPARAALDIQQWVTARGARVLFVENHELPMVDVSIEFAAGSSRDSAPRAGLASLTRSLMALGAGPYTEREITERFADVGAQLGGRFEADRAGFQLRSLSASAQLEPALQTLAAIIARPRFEADILAREKTRLIALLREADTQPDTLGEKAFAAAIYGEHPYALPLSGTPESVAVIEREQVEAFYREHYTAANASLAIMGDLSRAQAEALAEQLTRELPAGMALLPAPDLPGDAPGSERVIPHHATQSHLYIGLPAMTRDDPEYFPLLVGNYVLGGGGFDSRLMQSVRQNKGLAYSVYSYFSPMQAPGPFRIGLQTRREATDEALRTVREELARYLQDGPGDAELAQAKNNLVGGFPLRLDSNKKILEYLAMIGFYRLPLNWLDTYIPQVQAVTRADILRAFRERVRPERLHTVIVGGQPGGEVAGGAH